MTTMEISLKFQDMIVSPHREYIREGKLEKQSLLGTRGG